MRPTERAGGAVHRRGLPVGIWEMGAIWDGISAKTPGFATTVTAAKSHAVLSLELGRHVVPITWGNLTLTEDERAPGVDGLKSWSLAAELADIDVLDTAEYLIRAELDNGEVLVGKAILGNANGRNLTLHSVGAWTGMSGW